MRLRCLIVDDNLQFLRAVGSVLGGEGIDVVGTATTSDEALREAKRLRPDVALVDVNLGEENGFDLSRRLVEAADSDLRIVLISTQAEEDFQDLIASSPVAGFIRKTRLSARAVRELLAA
jgi:DNA-binding NarL/FixJ family response regulator